MSKEQSRFLLGVIAYLSLVFYIFGLAGTGSVQDPVSAPAPAPAPATELLCFNLESKVLRASDSNLGCLLEEESLGDSPIKHEDIRPNALNPIVEVRFLAAQAAAKAAGFSIRITSGFRSQALQEKLFGDAIKKYGSEEEASKWVLPKDISHHPWGTAIDVNYPGDKTAVKWLEDNGSLFGLCRVYENEWWHFEPIIAPGDTCPAMMVNALESLEQSPTGANDSN
ncbi:MAG: hypothetical protein F2653_00105 [Actinobacteria bacterium]|uniref:Unannotated protein n=1 Tax=freshwater metagenome TaxID=449393 RepID=A0A6J7FL49_9ZZZZ|nr:hypothetical protein [Actinomycetota bacterium]MSW22409.1 hypothetical protein [Actinomycetota bacterium]MSX03791.1 hypothetical protein [Actinomycetota bacterium]MSX60854.1 hypothetical protein [Actinomycetota bacterium]MSX83813.1 hypothetical protein [Actinomycetota bacterium]